MKIRGQTVHSPQERIKRMCTPAPSGCWEWRTPGRGGYGRLMVGSRQDGSRRSVSAHRYSYEAFVGEIPAATEVCHRCDNRRCVNPSHLFLGSRQDNIDDRENKGRNKIMRGAQQGNAKLTDGLVEMARSLRAQGHTYSSIAARFGVDRRTITQAIKGESWAHVPAPPSSDGREPKEQK